jgi:hypothetical protein
VKCTSTCTVTLPTNPVDGHVVIIHTALSSGSITITIGVPTGVQLNGTVDGTMTITNDPNGTRTFFWSSSTSDWTWMKIA